MTALGLLFSHRKGQTMDIDTFPAIWRGIYGASNPVHQGRAVS